MKAFAHVFIIGVIPVLFLLCMRSDSTAQNLIMNPGCEDSLVGGGIPFWEEVTGSNWTQRKQSPEPQEGDNYFFPGVAASAELRQDVDVSGYGDAIDSGDLEFDFIGYVRSYSQSPPDYSRIVVEYLDSPKTAVLYAFDSENIANTTEWVIVSDKATAPAGTRFIRIRLISTRRNGSNNDGYYDNLSLTPVDPISVNEQNGAHPDPLIVSRNYPNPFNPVTTIEFTLGFDNPRPVSVTVYDCRGNLIRKLTSGIFRTGMHSVQWDGMNEKGNRVSSGVYLYKIQSGQCIEAQKMLLVR